MMRAAKRATYWGGSLLAAVWLVTGATHSALAATKTNAAPSKAKSKEAAVVKPVDVNSADAKTLETLPGIGPTLSKRIIDGRPYQSLSDLGKVKGMSQSKLEAIKNDVTFGSATTTAKKEKAAKTAGAADTNAPPATAKAGAAKTTQTAPTPTGGATGKLAPGEKINLNTANAKELDRLPGIGPTRAQAIIDYRTQNGSFKTIEDVQKVKGIKAGEFGKIKDYIKVD